MKYPAKPFHNAVEVISTDLQRANFTSLKKNPGYEGKTIAPSTLRLEATIRNNQSVYSFVLNRDDTNQFPTERRLDRSDRFAITKIGLFLINVDVANRKGNAVLQSFATPGVFAAQAPDLELFYNSILKLIVNNDVLIEGISTHMFRHVPDTQKTVAGAVENSVTGFNGYQDITPNFVLDGSVKTDINIIAPVHNGANIQATTAGFENRLVLMLEGYHINNGSFNK